MSTEGEASEELEHYCTKMVTKWRKGSKRGRRGDIAAPLMLTLASAELPDLPQSFAGLNKPDNRF